MPKKATIPFWPVFFLADRDETAFATLLWRHGPMVFGVARRLLNRDQDAEDVVQATFRP
jgi:DNA-directed RNA polymerase specialized sigma24 family protein